MQSSPTPPNAGTRAKIGTALALSTAIAFALTNASASLAYQGGSNPLTVAAIRFLLPVAVLLVWLRLRGTPYRLAARDGWVCAGLGVVTAIYSWTLLSALAIIPLALAILVFYLFPLIAALILAAFGWERLGWRTVAAIVLAFVGLALALDPRGGGLNVEGVVLALIGAIGLATVIAVSSRVIKAGDSRPVTLYISAVAGLLLIAFSVVEGDFALPRSTVGWLGFAGTTVFYAYAIVAFFIAISMIGPVRVSLLSYAEPVAAAGLGFALLGEALTPMQIGGIAVVVTALVGATLWQPRAH